MTFKTAAVIGTGMMGPGIAAVLARGGLRATILSRSAASAASALVKAREIAGDRAQLLHASTDSDAVCSDVDLVIESAPEDLAFKQDLFAHLDAIARPSAVLATNTSGLSITAIQSKCTRPERVVTTHFWNPPHLMPLVEVVPGARSSLAVALAVKDLLAHCGKVPVLVKQDRPGQLGNRLQSALMREAINIVAEGIADAEDVDLTIKNTFGVRFPVYGLLEHIDMVGLDLVKTVVDYATPDLYNQPQAPPLLGEMIAQGRLGVKSGQGFYDWSTRDAAQVRARRDAFIREFTAAASGQAVRASTGVDSTSDVVSEP